MPRSAHTVRILNLYKTILRLHQYLPKDLKSVGDKYVKNEFRLHKQADKQFLKSFIYQWDDYRKSLEIQVKRSPENIFIGSSLTKENLDKLSEDQLLQLYELKTLMDKQRK